MNKLDIKHIFFDLDHTLWDFDRNSMLAFERIFKSFNISVPLKDFLKVYEPINFNYWKMYREERIDRQGLQRGRFQDSFRPFGVSFSLKELDDLTASYINELPKDNYLFDGVVEMLDYLLKKNYTMHIITNGFEEVQHLKLKNSSIDHFFRTVTTSEEVGVKKPNPLVFKKALQKANATPIESVMVGDTFEADILGAEKVGMHTLFFNYRNENQPSQYRVIDQIVEIKKHL